MDDSKDQPIHKAAGDDANELVRLLDENPALRDALGWYGRLPLHMAAEQGNLQSLEVLLQRGADPNYLEALHGQTPLHHAVASDSLDCTNRLLDAGADVNAADNRDETPIFYARSREVIGKLVEAGADLGVISNRGQYPFQYCAAYIGSSDVLRFWLDHGVTINHVPRFGWPALHAPCGGGIPERLIDEDGRIELMRLLLDYGADIDLQDQTGATALYYACVSHLHLTKCVHFLLEKGANTMLTYSTGDTPLHMAVSRGYADIVELLIKHGADPSAANDYHDVPLDLCDKGEDIHRLLSPVTNKASRPLPTAESVLDRLRAIPKYQNIEFKGCTDAEIDQLETSLSVRLPKSYRSFLRSLGRGAGDFMISDHWRFQVGDVHDMARNNEYSKFCDLPDNYFVIAERNGYWCVFFVADGESDDPPVFGFDDGEERVFKQVARSVWEFVELLVIDYEHWSEERMT